MIKAANEKLIDTFSGDVKVSEKTNKISIGAWFFILIFRCNFRTFRNFKRISIRG